MSVWFAHTNGLGEQVIPAAQMPAALLPDGFARCGNLPWACSRSRRQKQKRSTGCAGWMSPPNCFPNWLISEDMATVTIFASSDKGTDLSRKVPNQYPAMATNAWRFDVVDDLLTSPYEVGQPPAALGGRGCLRRSAALEKAKFNKSKAAKALGLTRHQLYVRMRKHGFDLS